jgi:hypothetical protein
MIRFHHMNSRDDEYFIKLDNFHTETVIGIMFNLDATEKY